MIKFIKQFFLADGKINPAILNSICKQSQGVRTYGELYQLTYNQQTPSVDTIVDFMRKHKITSSKKVLEIMGGNGVETMLINRELPKNIYTVSDIEVYYDKIKGLDYIIADCTDVEYNTYKSKQMKGTMQDFVFIGGANASMCMLLTLPEILRLGIFLQNTVKLGGYAALSFYEDTTDDAFYDCDYRAIEINGFPQYKGMYSHWFSITRRNPETAIHQYYTMAAVSKDEILTPTTKYEKVLHSIDNFCARSWHTPIVVEIMRKAGFDYIGEHGLDLDTRFMPFQKMRVENLVSYL